MMPKAKPKELEDIPAHFTEVIAERRLTLLENGRRKRVLVRIGAPVRDVPVAGGLDWRCPIRITGRRQELFGCGVDSLQALIHALQMVQITLNTRSESGTLEWLGMPDLGLAAIRTPRLTPRQRKQLSAALETEGLPPMPAPPKRARAAQ